MNIVVISLERAKERRDRISAQLGSLGLPFIMMDAVDGKALSPDDMNKKIHLPGGYRFGEVFRPGEIGCTMSHIKALQLAKEKGWEYVIILEDDVVLAEDFQKRIKLLFKLLPPNWEHVYLSGIPRIPKTHEPLIHMLHIEPSVVIDCIPATMIRDISYEKIITYLEKFETTTDDSIIAMIFKYKNLKSYTYYPFCAYVEDDFTYIWDHELKRDHKSKLYFKNKLNG